MTNPTFSPGDPKRPCNKALGAATAAFIAALALVASFNLKPSNGPVIAPPPVVDTTHVPAPTPVSSYDALTFASDGSGIGGTTAIPFAFDVAKSHPTDAQWRTTIANYGQAAGSSLAVLSDRTLAGTSAPATSALYYDGRYPDLIQKQPSGGPSNDALWAITIKAQNLAAESPTPELEVRAGQRHSLWIWVRRRYEAPFIVWGDATGAAAAWSATQGAGFKIGPYAAYGYKDSLSGGTYYGRAGLQTGSGVQGQAVGDYTMVNVPGGVPQPVGIPDLFLNQRVGPEWTDNQWRDVLVYVGSSKDVDGVIRVHANAYQRVYGTANAFAPIGIGKLTGVIGPATNWQQPRFDELTPFSLNYNHARSTDAHYYVWGWAAFDAEKYPNPYAVAGIP